MRDAPDAVAAGPALVVVIPTYNERENLGPLLAGVRESLKDSCVLIVDDNSPDGTGQEAEGGAKRVV